MIGEGDCGEIGGMKIGRGNRTYRLPVIHQNAGFWKQGFFYF
jgi:hypothetical protein